MLERPAAEKSALKKGTGGDSSWPSEIAHEHVSQVRAIHRCRTWGKPDHSQFSDPRDDEYGTCADFVNGTRHRRIFNLQIEHKAARLVKLADVRKFASKSRTLGAEIVTSTLHQQPSERQVALPKR